MSCCAKPKAVAIPDAPIDDSFDVPTELPEEDYSITAEGILLEDLLNDEIPEDPMNSVLSCEQHEDNGIALYLSLAMFGRFLGQRMAKKEPDASVGLRRLSTTHVTGTDYPPKHGKSTDIKSNVRRTVTLPVHEIVGTSQRAKLFLKQMAEERAVVRLVPFGATESIKESTKESTKESISAPTLPEFMGLPADACDVQVEAQSEEVGHIESVEEILNALGVNNMFDEDITKLVSDAQFMNKKLKDFQKKILEDDHDEEEENERQNRPKWDNRFPWSHTRPWT